MTTFELWRLAFRFTEMRLVGALTALAALGLAFLRPPFAEWLPAAGAGVLGWGAAEYVFHRFVLHMPAPQQKFFRRLHGRLHWKHHQNPDEPRLLFVPLFGDIFLFGVAALAGGVTGGRAAALGSVVGLGLALLHYEATHLAAHVAYVPRTRWGRFLKRFHRLHHYKNEHYWYGVTHPFVDKLVGTWRDHREVEKSSTARTLGIEPEAL